MRAYSVGLYLNEIVTRIKYYSFGIWYWFHIYQETDINTILPKYHNLIHQFWHTLRFSYITLRNFITCISSCTTTEIMTQNCFICLKKSSLNTFPIPATLYNPANYSSPFHLYILCLWECCLSKITLCKHNNNNPISVIIYHVASESDYFFIQHNILRSI